MVGELIPVSRPEISHLISCNQIFKHAHDRIISLALWQSRDCPSVRRILRLGVNWSHEFTITDKNITENQRAAYSWDVLCVFLQGVLPACVMSYSGRTMSKSCNLPDPRFNIKVFFSRYLRSHLKDKTVVRRSYRYISLGATFTKKD